ncbi:MAG: hypothetical protein JST06_01005 [Bacteroidetes bacterium]|nr:hypothetical protein [Bacteroidota bacterium]MBS1630174.1 hypothetical protein [Bacteroidota bacterium]
MKKTTAENGDLFLSEEGMNGFQRFRTELRWLVGKMSFTRLLAQVPYITFLALIAIIYIANGHRSVEMQREINTKQRELKELRWRYMDAKTRLMNVTMESKVIVSGARLGLLPLTLPAYSIVVSDSKTPLNHTP